MVSDGRLYTGRLKRATRALGLHTHLASLYWRLRIPRFMYAASSRESVVHEIGDLDVRFPTETYPQYRRFRWMHPELQLFEELVDELEPGDVFYDVGAYLGWHSIVAASVDDTVDVVAFEPHPTTAARLRRVVAATGHDVDVREVALSDAADTVSFAAAPDPAAHLADALDRDPVETITVETAAGDDLVSDGRLPPPDVVKIDAEGADAAVLRGLRETIERHRPRRLYVEVHRDRRTITALLEELGYDHAPLDVARPVLEATPER